MRLFRQREGGSVWPFMDLFAVVVADVEPSGALIFRQPTAKCARPLRVGGLGDYDGTFENSSENDFIAIDGSAFDAEMTSFSARVQEIGVKLLGLTSKARVGILPLLLLAIRHVSRLRGIAASHPLSGESRAITFA